MLGCCLFLMAVSAGPVRFAPEALPAGVVLKQVEKSIPDLHACLVESAMLNTTADVQALPPLIGLHGMLSLDGGEAVSPYLPLDYRNDQWYGSTYWGGPDWVRVGRDWQHTGLHADSVRSFKAPRPGRITISGRIYKADTNNGGGDGVRAEIRHNRKSLWAGKIEGSDRRGVTPSVSLAVKQGDRISFVLNKGKTITYDTTHWDPVITYDDGKAFRASEGFSSGPQGARHWFYEMTRPGAADEGAYRAYWFSADFSLNTRSMTAGRTVSISSKADLPFVVFSRSHGRGGWVVGMQPTEDWQLQGTLSRQETLNLDCGPASGLKLKGGETRRCPPLFTMAFRGHWLKGLEKLETLLNQPDKAFAACRQSIAAAYRGLCSQAVPFPDGRYRDVPELSLMAMIQSDWARQDGDDLSAEDYQDRARKQADRALAMITCRRSEEGCPFSKAAAGQLRAWQHRLAGPPFARAARRRLYLRVRWLKRQIALAHPLMQFGRLFFCKRVPTSYSHLVMQYYGWRARPGGGLYVLENPGFSLFHRAIAEGHFEQGNILAPRLSYDARRIVFSFVQCPAGKAWSHQALDIGQEHGRYHVYTINVDGTGLRQLTDGPWDDVMPAWLPDGGIVFCSTRRRGYARCFGPQFSRRWHVYTLHRMDPDGDNLRTLSYHDTNEWFPAVSHTGHVVYSRWDYIDRDAVTHQNLWATRPDGANPVALWGNATASPHCTFQMQPVPGSGKWMFTASAHHSITAGSIALLDPDVADDGRAAIERLTPEVPFPEAESRHISEYYAAPWPLSEGLYLAAYSPYPLVWEPGANRRDALGIYLMDRAGNRELIFRDPGIGSTNPCPLAPRRMPPVIPAEGIAKAVKDPAATQNPEGEMCLLDVYQGLGDLPRGTVRRIRVIQVFPKTTPVANAPKIGAAGEENARAVLGTVPVAPDGSAYFRVPAKTPLLFQALDADGFAVQTMRSLTYVQPGERVSCIGCHEDRMTAPPALRPMAFQKAAAMIEPGPFDGRPFSFQAVVQPVLDRHCVECHRPNHPDKLMDLTDPPMHGFTRAYWHLTQHKGRDGLLVPRFPARNQIQTTRPGGAIGARGSPLIKMLKAGHHKVKLSPEEYGRLALWIDCNAVFYGTYDPADQARQLAGEKLSMPAIK